MAGNLNATFSMSMTGSLDKPVGLDDPIDQLTQFPFQNVNFGTGTTGFVTGNNWWTNQRTIAAGGTDTITYSAITDHPFGETVSPTAILALAIAIVPPGGATAFDGVGYLTIGPQSATGACTLDLSPSSAVETVYTQITKVSGPSGWTPGTNLTIKNPSSESVTYAILVVYR